MNETIKAIIDEHMKEAPTHSRCLATISDIYRVFYPESEALKEENERLKDNEKTTTTK